MSASLPFVGIQVGPHTLFDEGIDHALDFIQTTSAANALIVYSHTYYGGGNRAPIERLAQDHGVPLQGQPGDPLPRVWAKPRESFYRHTSLRHAVDPSLPYADRDLFAELEAPAKERGLQVYARVLEGNHSALPDLVKRGHEVKEIDAFGVTHARPCLNHPAYLEFWCATIRDMMKSYALDGFQFGHERGGTLAHTLFQGTQFADTPTCFCAYCLARADRENVDAVRAREGLKALHECSRQWGEPDGNSQRDRLMQLLRLFFQYPEVLAWEQMSFRARTDFSAALYETVKAAEPEAKFGLHIDHRLVWDPFFRITLDYEDLARRSADWIKPIMYHDVAGPRTRWWLVNSLHKTFLSEFPEPEILRFFYHVMGLDEKKMPALDELDQQGFGPDYVYQETSRAVRETQGEAAVYSSIGLDVPWGRGDWTHFPSDPSIIEQSIEAAVRGGAKGIVISREYQEMQKANLEAVGRAVRNG